MCRIPSLNTQHVEPWSRWAPAAEDHTGCRSCQIEQDTEDTIHTGSPNRTIEDCKTLLVDESWFLLQHSDVGSEFGVKNMKAWIHPALSHGSGWWWWCNSVGDIFLAHFGPLSTNWHRLNATVYWVLLLTMSIPLWLQCTIFWCTSSRIMHHVTKLKSSQTGFLNMTMSSLYSNDLHSHQISIQ